MSDINPETDRSDTGASMDVSVETGSGTDARIGTSSTDANARTDVTPYNSLWLQAFAQLEAELRMHPDPGDLVEIMAQLAGKASGADAALVYLGEETTWLCEAAKGNPRYTKGFLGSQLCVQDCVQLEPHLGTAKSLRPLTSVAADGADATSSTPTLDSAVWIPLYGTGSTGETENNAGSSLSGMAVLARRINAEPFAADILPMATVFVGVCCNFIRLLQSYEPTQDSLRNHLAKVSRDLHDLVIQQLFATGMELDQLSRKFFHNLADTEDVVRTLQHAQSNLDESIQQIRLIVDGIKESQADAPLIEGIITEVSRARGALGFAPSLLFELDDLVLDPGDSNWRSLTTELCDRVSPDLTQNVVAVVREALSNITRHAKARAASIRVTVNGDGPTGELLLTIIDDGVGVDLTVTRRSGLTNMRERANEHGGSFSVSAGPRDQGTSVVWRAPLKRIEFR